jgi:hypothetical protein
MRIYTTHAAIDIEVGVIIIRCDPRSKDDELKVVNINESLGTALVRNLETQRVTCINLTRLAKTYGHNNGYRLVRPLTSREREGATL